MALREALMPDTVTEAVEAFARGEIVIVIAPPAQQASEWNDGEIDALLRRALERASVKDAVSEVADATGRPKREIYRRALALAEEANDGEAR